MSWTPVTTARAPVTTARTAVTAARTPVTKVYTYVTLTMPAWSATPLTFPGVLFGGAVGIEAF